MTYVGIDITQFMTDPYASGIQRVIQYLAREWPRDEIPCEFVTALDDDYLVIQPATVARVLDDAFAAGSGEGVRGVVREFLAREAEAGFRVQRGTLLSMFSAWLLPEVSYLPQVVELTNLVRQLMPCTMVGYDALPMTEPGNYRFPPGSSARVSEYFRMLATAERVVCISDFTRKSLFDRLRRDRSLVTIVAHPGGDHVPESLPKNLRETAEEVTFLRVGTLEARKMPAQIADSFLGARQAGSICRLEFIGNPSASDAWINDQIRVAATRDRCVTWEENATDDYVYQRLTDVDVFLSFGIEGFGIPVLEAIRLGTPVVYGGVQPAADLMAGKGSYRLPSEGRDSMIQMFTDFSDRRTLETLTKQVDPSAVPRWKDFAIAVAHVSAGG